MKKFIVYIASGEIQRTGTCSDDDFELQAGPNELIIEGEANDATQIIVEGVIVDKPLVPPPPFDINAARLIKSNEISNSCEAFIVAGFTSNALGTIHTYPSNRDDQLNLSGTIQRSMMVGVLITDNFAFLCRNPEGIWGYVNHTPARIQQVGKDAYNHILNARVKNATLQAQIAACTTQAQLDNITW